MSDHRDPEPIQALPLGYASGGHRRSSSLWAAALVSLAGLGLIVIGGCFLIGVLMLVTHINPIGGFTGRQTLLMVVLYALATASFVGAVVLLVIGLRGLLIHPYGPEGIHLNHQGLVRT